MNRIALAFALAGVSLLHAEAGLPLAQRYEAEIRRQERQLRRLQQDLREKSDQARALRKQAESARTRWEELRASMQSAKAQARRVRDSLLKTNREAQIAGWQAAMNQRLSEAAEAELGVLTARLYRQQTASGSDVDDWMLSRIVSRLTGWVPGVRQDAAASAAQEEQLRELERRWQAEADRRQQQALKIEHDQAEQWEQWKQAERRERRIREEIAQAEQSAQALQVMLARLRKSRDHAQPARAPSSGDDRALAALRGRLPWPAPGAVVQGFGKQYSSDLNQLLISNGIRIQAEPGQNLRAVKTGQVLFARPFRQYGQMVVIQHAGGLASVYAGLESIVVQEGAQVGDLEALGKADGTGRYYFELRQEERPLNPLVYLTPLRRGPS